MQLFLLFLNETQVKHAAFKEETKTHKTVHLTMIATYSVKRNQYLGNIQSEVTVNDLFK